MLDWLYSLRRFGMKPGLERISAALEILDNPQDKIKTIHVTGTNGKGSVSAMIESILRTDGKKTGMFTSPHLVDFRERLQINRQLIHKEDTIKLVEKVKATGVELTFFELTTAMAFLYFQEQNVDYAVIEVGMGGLYDATNVIKKPEACAITSLSLDHTQWLGTTINSIAAEKAGIIKENVPLFTPLGNEVVLQKCREKNAPLHLVAVREITNMNGEFQKTNAAIAANLCRYLKIPETSIKNGLMNTKWPARLEFIDKNVLLDCAHNTDGIEKMAEFVKTLKYDKLIIVFGVMNDKNYVQMISKLPDFDKIIFTKPKIERSSDPNTLKSKNSIVIENPSEALKYAKSIAKNNDLILICGSCYLAGELLASLKKIPIHPIMFLQ